MQIFEGDVVPLNARQVHSCLGEEFDLTTIYRGLQYLEQEQYLVSFVFDCSDRGVERYYVLNEEEHRHFMHCGSCHHFFPFSGCPFEGSLKDIQRETGFSVDQHFITLKGTCRDCSGVSS